jgi:DNA-binding NarL/FixJ family response regulator
MQDLTPTFLFVADDHHVFRTGLVRIIEECKSLKASGEAANGEAALEGIRKLKPDIAVLDISMPLLNGLEIARAVHKEGLKTAIVILSMHQDINYLYEALDAGVKGYLLKINTDEEIVDAIKSVAGGKTYITPVLFNILKEEKKQQERYLAQFPKVDTLTESEQRVLKLISKEMTSKEIAKELSVSYRTVQKHRGNICAKLGLEGWNSLLQFAVKNAANF